MRLVVCNEPTVDKALAICFRCASTPGTDSVYIEGLNSYIDSVRSCSGDMICNAISED